MTTRALKVGIQLPEVERLVHWPEFLAMAQRAEELGFDSLWIGDHLLYRNPGQQPKAPWEAWTVLSALAAATDRITLAPLVACTAFHNPAIIAKKAATLDEISNGRFVLGLGAGWNEAEFDAFGFPFDHRASRFEEAFTIIRSLLSDGYLDFHGEWHQVNDCTLTPLGHTSGGPPLMIGSNGERLLRTTLPWVQSWNAWYADFGNNLEKFNKLNERVTSLCEEVGRDPGEVERTAALLVACTGAGGRVSGYAEGVTLQPLSSEPGELTRALNGFAAAGVGHVQLVLDPITIDSIEEVAPVLSLLEGR